MSGTIVPPKSQSVLAAGQKVEMRTQLRSQVLGNGVRQYRLGNPYPFIIANYALVRGQCKLAIRMSITLPLSPLRSREHLGLRS